MKWSIDTGSFMVRAKPYLVKALVSNRQLHHGGADVMEGKTGPMMMDYHTISSIRGEI